MGIMPQADHRMERRDVYNREQQKVGMVRAMALLQRYEAGESVARLGGDQGVSRARVYQLLSRARDARLQRDPPA